MDSTNFETKHKKMNQSRPLKSLILISTPWPLYSRPSIQLGTLKAFLKLHAPDLEVRTHHFYLKVAEAIGYPLYQAISERTWLSETIYAALLFPERIKLIEKVYYKEAVGQPQARSTDFTTLINRVSEVSDAFINGVDWKAFGLAGFSICFCQLTSTLYFIKRIKEIYADLPVVVGGSMFSGESIQNLFEMFPEIDFVINGEGERPLTQLVHFLKDSPGNTRTPVIPGICSAETEKNNIPVAFSQMTDLSLLPPPDYADYFQLLKTLSPQKTFFPTIPAEISRGCWWRRHEGDDKLKGCAFCNLNLQWNGYRAKHKSQVISEIDYLTSKHKTLSVAFMDNLLPLKASDEIFTSLGQLNKDLRLFGEIRATTPRHVLESMVRGGIHKVQVGIEALSTRLLKKLNKGTKAIQNLEILKNCEALGILNHSNLILYFPGSDHQDVVETLRNLEFALPFHPLRCVQFWLGLGSPVWQHPKRFGIRAVFNHPNYAAIFPSIIFKSMRFMIQTYRGDMGYQRKLWQPVKKKVSAWKKAYAELHKGAAGSPVMNYRDGREFLIIRQRRLNQETATHRLVGTSRAIYLFCQQHQSFKSILEHFPGLGEGKIAPFLRMMVDKRLMFEENGEYLSLAVPIRAQKG
jgi:ribosomal peptide maturation radical SAM protein 1